MFDKSIKSSNFRNCLLKNWLKRLCDNQNSCWFLRVPVDLMIWATLGTHVPGKMSDSARSIVFIHTGRSGWVIVWASTECWGRLLEKKLKFFCFCFAWSQTTPFRVCLGPGLGQYFLQMDGLYTSPGFQLVYSKPRSRQA